MKGMSDFDIIRRKALVEVLHKYPDMKTRTMARLLHAQHPEMFPSVEGTRSLIRTVRDTKGNHHKQYKHYYV
jgi:hypothetical protein